MGMILRIASSRIVGQGDIVGRSGYFSLNLSANSVMRGRLDARRTLKSLVADLRYKKIYKELLEHPKTGLGHPEALRGGGDITWSRHITAHDRIIYDIYEEVVEVYILEVEGHYNDK